MKKIFLILLFSFIFCFEVFAYDDPQNTDYLIDEQLELFDFSQINSIISDLNYANEIDFKEIIKSAVLGEIDISMKDIINIALKQIFNEVFLNTSLIRNLIIICILSALLKNLTASFKQKETGELGFYISYIVIVIILFSSFSISIGILQDTSEELIQIMQGASPLIISLLAATGNISSAYTFHPLILFAVNILSIAIRNFVIPMITLSAIIQIINYITQRDILTKFSELIKSISNWGLKGIALLFTGILSIQKISSFAFNSAVNKTAKMAVNMVPVVGDVLTTTVDGVMNWTMAIKSGTSIAIVIIIVLVCMIPVFKLIALIFVYKFTAAIIQPVCDKRITNCIDAIGSYTIIILGALITIIVMFVFSVMIMLSTTGV